MATPEPADPTRVLKPWAPLERLRPVNLQAVIRLVRDYDRTGRALRLIQRHFKPELARYGDLSQAGWWEILADLFNLIEQAGWFAINWEALNQGWAYWQGDPAENGHHLATYLHYIPVRLYGLTAETRFEIPPLELMYALFAEGVDVVSTELLVQVELYDGLDEWREHNRHLAWRWLYDIEADAGRYPEPVRWLPELVRWACGLTRNAILDQHFEPQRLGPWYGWERIEEITTAWRRAKPTIDQGQRLMAWTDADEARLGLLADCLMEGRNYDHLDW